MALFPFLIVLTSLAGFFGSKELADQAAGLMLQTWPQQVADSLSGEIHDVLTTTRGDALTIGVVLAVYFASNGVESLRVALNRAYSVIEPRRWYWLRLESIGYTLIAAFTALAMAFLIVLGPLMLEAARRHIPLVIETNENFLTLSRYGITVTALIVALFILHAWLPAGRRGFLQILPGIIFTMVASLLSGIVFGQYLARFANNYVTMYAGLASVIIALVFLYFITAAAGHPDDRNTAKRRIQPANSPDGLDAVDARQYHVHQHRVETALRDPLRGGLATPDEFGLMTEFGEYRIEHHAAERIVFDAENAQRPTRLRRCVGFGIRTCRFRRLRAGQGHRQRECGAAIAPLRHDDVATHSARELFDRR